MINPPTYTGGLSSQMYSETQKGAKQGLTCGGASGRECSQNLGTGGAGLPGLPRRWGCRGLWIPFRWGSPILCLWSGEPITGEGTTWLKRSGVWGLRIEQEKPKGLRQHRRKEREVGGQSRAQERVSPPLQSSRMYSMGVRTLETRGQLHSL